jgi:hypothetical protein
MVKSMKSITAIAIDIIDAPVLGFVPESFRRWRESGRTTATGDNFAGEEHGCGIVGGQKNVRGCFFQTS